mgnify:CR=1 FL=1
MMENAYLVSCSVKGIKNIDTLVTLSFYKKTIEKDLDVQNYNIKGIYGVNGSGKSGIIMSMEILKNLICDSDYLNNPITIENILKHIIVNNNLSHSYKEYHFFKSSLISLISYLIDLGEVDYILKDGELLYYTKNK